MEDVIIDAIEFRLQSLKKTQELIKSSPESFTMVGIENEARIDELESLLDYVKTHIK